MFTMLKLIDLVQILLPRVESPAYRDEEYLNEAVDIYDLERRMREIDARAYTSAAWSPQLEQVLH